MKIKQILKDLDIVERCLEDAPVDFLGTGSNLKAANKEEFEWGTAWVEALKRIRAELNKVCHG